MKKGNIIRNLLLILAIVAGSCGKEDLTPKSKDSSSDKGQNHVVSPYPDMVFVEGGTFEQDKFLYSTDRQYFKHTISSFHMSKYEVRYQLWYEVKSWAHENGYTFSSLTAGLEGSADLQGGQAPTDAGMEPVTMVLWDDAVLWCNAYSEKMAYPPVYKNANGDVLRHIDSLTTLENQVLYINIVPDWDAKGFRLPTEGEWQFAASNRGETPRDYASGASGDYMNEDETDKVAWYDENSYDEGISYLKTRPVGTKKANVLGIFDMSGNAKEWCWDLGQSFSDGIFPYSDTAEEGTAQVDYRGPERVNNMRDRVIRGGSFQSSSEYIVVSSKGRSSSFSSDYGFRIVVSH